VVGKIGFIEDNMISFILVLLAAMVNAIMDKLAFNFNSSVFKDLDPKLWNPKESWKNKWRIPMELSIHDDYYLGLYKPPYQESFPFSSTFLVWLTDAWHLFKALFLGLIMLSIVLYIPIFGIFVDFILFYVGYTTVFTYLYDYILRK
jgi:hypothetical protein